MRCFTLYARKRNDIHPTILFNYSYVGDPIPYDASLSAEQLAETVREKMSELIQRHQQIPGSILRALIERLPSQTPHGTWTAVAAST